jgi:hypothetical protein
MQQRAAVVETPARDFQGQQRAQSQHNQVRECAKARQPGQEPTGSGINSPPRGQRDNAAGSNSRPITILIQKPPSARFT